MIRIHELTDNYDVHDFDLTISLTRMSCKDSKKTVQNLASLFSLVLQNKQKHFMSSMTAVVKREN